MVLLPALYLACSSAINSSAWGLSLFKMTFSNDPFTLGFDPLPAGMFSCYCVFFVQASVTFVKR